MLAPAGWLLWVSMTVNGLDEPGASEAVVSGCRDALGVDACRLGDAGDVAGQRALVTFEEGRVHVDVSDDGASGEVRSVTRDLLFLPQESLDQRLRAAGLLVAALSASLGERSREIEPEAEMNVELVAFTVRPQPLGRFWIDAGAASGLVWSNEWAFGGELRTTFAPGTSSWFVTASGRLLGGSARDTKNLWWSGGLGVGRELLPTTSPWSWWIHLEGVVEALDVSWQGADRSATRGGARLGTRLAWGDAIGPWLGFDATLAGPSVVVQRSGVTWLEAPVWQLNGLVGLRFRALGGEP